MSLVSLFRRTAITLTLGVAGSTLIAMRPAMVRRATGATFSYKMTTSSSDTRKQQAVNIDATVRMQGGKVRFDYAPGTGPMGQKGAWMLFTSSPAQIAIVSDDQKSVMLMDASLFGSGMGAMMNNDLMKITVKNATFSYKDLGAGDVILGYRTRHVRLYNHSESEVKVMGFTQRSVTNDSSDQWIATGIDVDQESLMSWGKSFSAGMKATNPELAKQFEGYQREYTRNAIALRARTYSTVTDGKGKETTDVITMEVTNLKLGAIDPSVFALPSGYKVKDMAKTMSDAMAEMDKAKAEDKKAGVDPADAEKGDAKAAEKAKADADKGSKLPTATDLIKAGIGGLLKKKPPVE